MISRTASSYLQSSPDHRPNNMKFLGVFLIAYLLCGVQCNFFDDLKHAASSVGHSIGQAASAVGDQVKHYGGQALQSALDTLTTDGVNQLVSAGLSAAGTAALTALVGKREMSKVDQAVTILRQDAATLEKVLHGYSADLQTVYNSIHNMEFLRHDPQKFLADIGVLKSRYESVLDNLAKNFQAKMSQLQSHDKRRGLLDGLASAFQKTVDTFKQTFGGVAGTVQGGGSDLLTNVFGHLSSLSQNLGTSLSGLKETGAQLLAQGQEHLQSLGQNAGTSVDQLHTGVLGAAKQVVDTVLHPQN